MCLEGLGLPRTGKSSTQSYEGTGPLGDQHEEKKVAVVLRRRGTESQLCMEGRAEGNTRRQTASVQSRGGGRMLTSVKRRRGRRWRGRRWRRSAVRPEPQAVHSGYIPSLHTSTSNVLGKICDLRAHVRDHGAESQNKPSVQTLLHHRGVSAALSCFKMYLLSGNKTVISVEHVLDCLSLIPAAAALFFILWVYFSLSSFNCSSPQRYVLCMDNGCRGHSYGTSTLCFIMSWD